MARIPNPFKEVWEEFDLDDFKQDILDIIDEIVDTNGEDESLFEELDEGFGELMLLLKYKDEEYMDIVSIFDLPDDVLEELGITEEAMADLNVDEDDGGGFIPAALVIKYANPERVKQLISDGIIDDPETKTPKGKKKSKNGKDMWLL